MGARRGRAVPAGVQSQRGLLKRQAPTARQGSTGHRTAGHCGGPPCAAGARDSGAARLPTPDPGGAADLFGGMGGEAGPAAALSPEGRVKSLGLVFQDERKSCYASGETVAGHVLLEAAEPVALSALRLEALGRATAAWGPSAGSAAPASASEVEYLNVRLDLLREAPAGERGDGPEVRVPAGTLGRGRAGRCPPARGAAAGSGAWGPPSRVTRR